MNATEVWELAQEAWKSGVLLMEVLWTCFFPASQQILSLLSLDGIREEKLLREEFEAPITGVPRIVEKELGGSTVLDIGCYVIHFACMVFRGEKPKSITASGFLCPTGLKSPILPLAESELAASIMN
ncbi:hypothetical protein Y1Q_0008427 [Alligator mississippiensis]|uniref:Uncharacterized protein n=1 Tax=Alligator mississippiensis TaxID=8496 RepID=A0A151NK22_ALLMI|nr:hypothetical protein Y1Q_0008427 [Alligator mississippiensis]